MAEQDPFGPSPYAATAEMRRALIDAADMNWTNNVQQHAPESAAEAWDAWDEALAEAHRVQDAAERFLTGVIAAHQEAASRLDDAEA